MFPILTNSSGKNTDQFAEMIDCEKNSSSSSISNTKQTATLKSPETVQFIKQDQQQWIEDEHAASKFFVLNELGDSGAESQSEDQWFNMASTVKMRFRMASTTAIPIDADAQYASLNSSPASSSSATSTPVASSSLSAETEEIAWCTQQPHPVIDIGRVQIKRSPLRRGESIINIQHPDLQEILKWTGIFLNRPEGMTLEFCGLKGPVWAESALIQLFDKMNLAVKPGKQIIMTLIHPVTDMKEFEKFCDVMSDTKLITGLHISGDKTLKSAIGIKRPLAFNPGLKYLNLSNMGTSQLTSFFSHLAQTSLIDCAGDGQASVYSIETMKLSNCKWPDDEPEFYSAMNALAENLFTLKTFDLSELALKDSQKDFLRSLLKSIGKEHILMFI